MFSLKQRLKFNHGSVLVFSLIVLFIGISAAIGIASSTLISQRSSMTTASSVQSFQVADSGAEIFLNKFKSADSDATLGSLGIGSCNSGNGLISGNIGTGRDYEIIAYDINNSPLACSASLSSVDRIKSVGKYKNTSRAVEMAVAAGGGEGITGGCRSRADGVIDIRWGSGCRADNPGVDQNCNIAATGYECGTASYDPDAIPRAAYCICIKK